MVERRNHYIPTCTVRPPKANPLFPNGLFESHLRGTVRSSQWVDIRFHDTLL